MRSQCKKLLRFDDFFAIAQLVEIKLLFASTWRCKERLWRHVLFRKKGQIDLRYCDLVYLAKAGGFLPAE